MLLDIAVILDHLIPFFIGWKHRLDTFPVDLWQIFSYFHYLD